MNENVLELMQGIFNILLFIVSVTFSMLLFNTMVQRSVSMDISTDNKNIYGKVVVDDSLYAIKGSSVIDMVCKMVSDNADMKVMVDDMVLEEDVVAGVCIGEPECISRFYEFINIDKDYVISFGYDSIKIGETDE